MVESMQSKSPPVVAVILVLVIAIIEVTVIAITSNSNSSNGNHNRNLNSNTSGNSNSTSARIGDAAAQAVWQLLPKEGGQPRFLQLGSPFLREPDTP